MRWVGSLRDLGFTEFTVVGVWGLGFRVDLHAPINIETPKQVPVKTRVLSTEILPKHKE